jgi:erythronate-4-phosphate dehydrogenase
VGIVGGGHVGGLFAAKLRRLNVEVLICDPPLQDLATEPVLEKYCPIEAIMQCDVVSLHVPLTKDNEHATYGMLNFERLSTLPQSALLINTCRGSVVDENALLELLNQRSDLTCIVDVWENEPVTNSALVQRVDIATPHIAGYSMEAKRIAMVHIFEQIQKEFSLPVQSQPIFEKDKEVKITGNLKEDPWATVLGLFPLCSLSEKFKESHKHENVADAFDQLRRNMLARREFNKITLPGANLTEVQRAVLQVLGIRFY